MSPAPWIGGSSSSASGVTRAVSRRAIASEIGHHRVVQATTHPDEPTLLIIPALRADGVSPARYDGHYVYSPRLDEARQIVPGSYDGPTWTVRLDDAFSDDLANEAGEITNTLPGTEHADLQGFNQIIDTALSKTRVWARLSFTGDGTYSHSLAEYDWLTSEDAIDHIEDRWWGIPSGDPTARSPFGWSVQQNGVDLMLVLDHAYASGEAFTVVGIRPGDRWVNTSGTWGSGNGLTTESSMAAVPLHWIRAFGCWQAAKYLLDVTEEDESLTDRQRASRMARYERLRKHWAAAAVRIKIREFPKPTSSPNKPLVGFGASPGYV